MSKQAKHLVVRFDGETLLDLRGKNVTTKSIHRAVRLFKDLVESERLAKEKP